MEKEGSEVPTMQELIEDLEELKLIQTRSNQVIQKLEDKLLKTVTNLEEES